MAVQRDAAGRAATAALLRAQIAVHEQARDVAQSEVDRQSALIGELEQALADLDLEAPDSEPDLDPEAPELEPEPDEPEPDPEPDPGEPDEDQREDPEPGHDPPDTRTPGQEKR